MRLGRRRNQIETFDPLLSESQFSFIFASTSTLIGIIVHIHTDNEKCTDMILFHWSGFLTNCNCCVATPGAMAVLGLGVQKVLKTTIPGVVEM